MHLTCLEQLVNRHICGRASEKGTTSQSDWIVVTYMRWKAISMATEKNLELLLEPPTRVILIQSTWKQTNPFNFKACLNYELVSNHKTNWFKWSQFWSNNCVHTSFKNSEHVRLVHMAKHTLHFSSIVLLLTFDIVVYTYKFTTWQEAAPHKVKSGLHWNWFKTTNWLASLELVSQDMDSPRPEALGRVTVLG